MESHAETFTTDTGAKVEVGTVSFQSKEFSNLGSVIDDTNGLIIGYPEGSQLQTWNGATIEGLTLRVVSSWRTPRSFLSDRMFAYAATYRGKRYHGRGAGDGMLLRLHASKG